MAVEPEKPRHPGEEHVRNDLPRRDRSTPVLLAEVVRGGIVESRHWGHIIVVEGNGAEVVSMGSPELVTFVRSAAKPFQALPLLATGAADRFGLEQAEVALVCGSHNGEDDHLRRVESVLEKAGLAPSMLRCGTQQPYDPEARRRLRERGLEPTPLHNTCSGKHAGMLALARFLGAPLEGYYEAAHPVQRAIAEALAAFASVDAGDLVAAKDGCGVPTYALPMHRMALMYARLVTPFHAPGAWREASESIVAAMTGHPEMVEGTAPGECLDTELMREMGARMVAKSGAEGLFTAGLRPCPEWPDGLGMVVKIEDGDGKSRARAPVVVELVRQLGLLDADLESLVAAVSPTLRNRRGEEVGRVRPAFRLPEPLPRRGPSTAGTA